MAPMYQDQEQSMDGMAPEASAGAGGYCIEIYVKPDGSFTVSKEMKEEPEPAADPAAPAAPEMSADNIGDALKMVLDIFEKEGGADEQDQFDQGFGAAKVAGNTNPAADEEI